MCHLREYDDARRLRCMNARSQPPGSRGHHIDLARRNVVPACAWQAGAAYLYMLRLDAVCLAWEYLRRNPDYVRDWSVAELCAGAPATAWGLVALEDPFQDARCAQPMWQSTHLDVPALVVVDDPSPSSSTFSVWAMPGPRSLWRDATRLTLTVVTFSLPLRIGMPADLSDGDAYGYVIAPGPCAQKHWRHIQACDARLRSGRQQLQVRAQPVDRRLLVHMRSLQALDGFLAGASHREIACALFGVSRVTNDWQPDGDLRAQVRFLIRRGRALMRGGYLALLGGDPSVSTRRVSRDRGART